MTGAHFLRDDVISTLFSTGLSLLLAVPPGYVVAWFTGLLNFRRGRL